MQTAQSLLQQLIELLELRNYDLSCLQIEGQEPQLPSPFPLTTAAAAVQACLGLALNQLWYLKTQRYQTIKLSLRDVAAGLLSHLYLKINGEPPKGLWDPLSGFYQCADERWLQLHCNFPNHRQGVVKFLGCADERGAVEAALKTHAAEELETKLSDLGLCAAMVRTQGEWRAHPQSQAIALLPLLEIIKIADSDPKPLPAGLRPLAGIKALDLTRVIAGPVAGKTLAEHGADVLYISSPHLPSIESLVIDTGFGKRCAYLDLNQTADHQQLLNLAKETDIFLQAYRPGGLAARGFGAEQLAKLNPHIICIDLTAYSQAGPWANKHGYDSLVQCATGIVAEQTTGDTPTHLPAQALDYICGYLAALAASIALYRRATEGGSYLIRLSLAQTAHWLKSLERISYDAQTKSPKAEDVPHLIANCKSHLGELEHLLPILRLSETPAYSDKPPARLGSHIAAWT